MFQFLKKSNVQDKDTFIISASPIITLNSVNIQFLLNLQKYLKELTFGSVLPLENITEIAFKLHSLIEFKYY